MKKIFLNLAIIGIFSMLGLNWMFDQGTASEAEQMSGAKANSSTVTTSSSTGTTSNPIYTGSGYSGINPIGH